MGKLGLGGRRLGLRPDDRSDDQGYLL